MFSIRRQTYRKGNPMHAAELLHDLLDNACQSIDKRIRKSLFSAAEALTRCKQLSIAALGRSLDRSAKVKHTIKCMDRLFGNRRLHMKSHVIYKAIAERLLKNNKRPIIIVDWSGLTPCGAYYFLRASVAVTGRSLTLYSQAYALKEYTAPKTHNEFLRVLKSILPDDCIPIIVTDAGFRNTWFRAVLTMGWDFIGRVRNNTHYQSAEQKAWLSIHALYQCATEKAAYIGQVLLARASQLDCHFYLMKLKKKFRVKRNLAGKKIQCSVSKKHEKGANEPWLIASSLSPEKISASDVMSLYEKRMQIEEEFRDLKNTRNGFGLRHCRSFKASRLNIALLIATLANLILWMFGVATKQKNMHFSFQANTIKTRNILSIITIGWQALMSRKALVNIRELKNAFKLMASLTTNGDELC
jgi:hypothetical protein